MLTLEGQKIAAERVGCLKTPNYGVIKRDMMLGQTARFFLLPNCYHGHGNVLKK